MATLRRQVKGIESTLRRQTYKYAKLRNRISGKTTLTSKYPQNHPAAHTGCTSKCCGATHRKYIILLPNWPKRVHVLQPPSTIDSHSHLLAQGCCYHCPARSQLPQRGPLLQLPERESDHPAREESYTLIPHALQWYNQTWGLRIMVMDLPFTIHNVLSNHWMQGDKCSDTGEIRHFLSLVASRSKCCRKKLAESRVHGAKRFKEYGTYQEYGMALKIRNAGQIMANT